MKRAAYIGRFQPFTKTHRKIIQYIDNQKDIGEIIIVKGSIQWNDKNPSPNFAPSRNPFTADECCEMINLALDGRIKKPHKIIRIPDTLSGFTDPLWKEWTGLILNELGKNDFVVFTNNKREAAAFERVGVECRSFYVESGIRATLVREIIVFKTKEEWLEFVDKEIADYLVKINAKKRVTDLFLMECRK